ncbi:DnaJ domain-containing protein [uncultured Thermosynechococcus sp.]|uniref:J domain-containing protein n=1 Tax=uncultured Thermosynechococcus sp. TaxID=436945 RepID=UPI00262E4210|nr:DnaJ domain-containing protein [uncultured Thermosynechococcus sp.]
MPRASKAEIKEAYRHLCKECPPDKLPPETPKKARQIVEEHFQQINEAYAYLMEHADKAVVEETDSERWDLEVEESLPIFDPICMEAVARRLERERSRIEQEYQQAIREIEKQQRQKLAAHGLRIDDLKALDSPQKWGKVIENLILGLIGLAMIGIGGLIGFLTFLWSCFCFWAMLACLFIKTVSHRQYKFLCSVKTETELAKNQASCQKRLATFANGWRTSSNCPWNFFLKSLFAN